MHRPLEEGFVCFSTVIRCTERTVLKLAGPLPRAFEKIWNVLVGRLSHVEVTFKRFEWDSRCTWMERDEQCYQRDAMVNFLGTTIPKELIGKASKKSKWTQVSVEMQLSSFEAALRLLRGCLAPAARASEAPSVRHSNLT